MFHLMRPNSKIYPHTDSISIPATINHRIHIPISTKKDIIFHNGDDSIHMKEGHVYLIDNTKIHSIQNKTKDTDRIHLIIDWYTHEPKENLYT